MSTKMPTERVIGDAAIPLDGYSAGTNAEPCRQIVPVLLGGG